MVSSPSTSHYRGLAGHVSNAADVAPLDHNSLPPPIQKCGPLLTSAFVGMNNWVGSHACSCTN